LHHLDLHRVPDLRAGWRVEGRAVLPGGRVERALIDGARWSDHARVTVHAGLGGERKRLRAGREVVGVRIGGGTAAATLRGLRTLTWCGGGRWRVLRARHEDHACDDGCDHGG